MIGLVTFERRRDKQTKESGIGFQTAFFYPSCPKSLVKSSNFFRSAEFTVGLEVASDRSMSVYKKKNEKNLNIIIGKRKIIKKNGFPAKEIVC